MRVHWFSPLPPEKSGIALDYVPSLVEPLSHLAELCLWHPTGTTSQPLPRGVRLERWTGKEWRTLHQADAVVFCLGNDARFHHWIWEVLGQTTGLVILHDCCLFDLFWGYFHRKGDFGGFALALSRYYGLKDATTLSSLWKGANREQARRYSFTELVLEKAHGAIVHTQEAWQEVCERGLCPVWNLPLPYRSRRRKGKEIRQRRRPALPLRLISFGLWGPHRRLLPFLEALASFPDRHCFRYDVLGPIPPDWNLEKRVEELGLTDVVSIYGWVAEDTLDALLSKADLAVNLRYPSMGEASGSQLRIWEHALPTLAIRDGWFETVPTELGLWIRPDHETEDIHRSLSFALENPKALQAMGEAAYTYLCRHHDPARYARRLLEILQEAEVYHSLPVWRSLSRRVAEELARWKEDDEDWLPPEFLIEKIAQELARFAGCTTPLAPSDSRQ